MGSLKVSEFLNCIQLWSRNKTKIALSVGIGGFLSLYISSMCKNVLVSLSSLGGLENIIENAVPESIAFTNMEVYISIISLIALISVPFTCDTNKKYAFHIWWIIFSIAVDFMLLVRMAILQSFDCILSVAITFSCIYFIWLITTFLKTINIWIRAKDGKPDAAKLIFIWINIVTIWGLSK